MNEARQFQERRQYLASLQLMFTVALALGMLLAFQFARRITDSRPLHSEYRQTTAEVTALQVERDELREQLSFIQSDAYVEIWARGEAKMVREGETLVFTVPETASAGATEPEANASAERSPGIGGMPAARDASPNWHLWWQLFFDSAPPG